MRQIELRSKIWLVDEKGKPVFGLGRLRILEAIDRSGSILAASRELGMSYRAVWGRIKATEERLGAPLLRRNIGGRSGGGSELTGFARNLMDRFKRLHHRNLATSDQLFAEIILPLYSDE